MLKAARHAAHGTVLEETIAKGLPARNGKNSKFVPLVPNALERVLRPQTNEGERVDMRNLGEVICVKVNTPVLRRTPPTKGRTGFDVKGNTIPAVQGEWIDFKMGTGTVVSDSDANLLMSSISGMPKYRDQVMNIDDTFTCNGVNVGTAPRVPVSIRSCLIMSQANRFPIGLSICPTITAPPQRRRL